MKKHGFKSGVNAYRYKIVDIIVGNNAAKSFAFPEFTTEINLEDGELLNLPSQLTSLTLFNTNVNENVMTAIGNSQHSVYLDIYDVKHSVVFRGFPQWLEKLFIETQSEPIYTEGPGYNYDCNRLKSLRILCNDGSIGEFPKDFVDSIVDNSY